MTRERLLEWHERIVQRAEEYVSALFDEHTARARAIPGCGVAIPLLSATVGAAGISYAEMKALDAKAELVRTIIDFHGEGKT